MADKEPKVKTKSNFFLRLMIYLLLPIVFVQTYIILKTKRFIEEKTGEKSISKFVESEFEKDTKSLEELFESFLSDTSKKSKQIKSIKREDISRKVQPTKEKFDRWYEDKFGSSSITHTSELKGNNIVVTVSIPGVIKESVDITVQDNIIKMSGSLKGEGRAFKHSILVPGQADAKSSKVDFDAGANRINIIFRLKG